MSAAAINRPDFWDAYREADRDTRVRHAKAGCVLTLLLVPAGSSLDYFVYPELLWPIFQGRVICDLFVLPVFLLLFTGFGRRHVGWLGSVWALVAAVCISWMIYISEGAASPYYAGLNLVIIVACILMPYTMVEALVVCLLVIGMYVVVCALHQQTGAPATVRDVYNNLYFMAITSIIVVTSCRYYTRNRIEDFRLRHELDERNKQLAELDRLKSEFFANVSHELRTPLTLIISPLEELLRREPDLPKDVGRLLHTIKNNGMRLLKLINDLLEIVRLEEGRLEIDRTAIDLTQLVPGIVDSVRHLGGKKGLTIRTHGVDRPVVISGDASRMEKVLLNLLTNAIKFTPAGGVIDVRLRVDDDADQVRIDVADTGIGIPEDDLPHIFDRFRQVDGSSTRRYQGVGLGLALARELVEEHDGRLSVISHVEQGTTFTIELPLASSQSAAAQPAEQGGEIPEPILETFRQADRLGVHEAEASDGDAVVGEGDKTLLVIEDEPDMRQFLVSVLSRDYRVVQAADGETGIGCARRHRPDLVVLDMMLPGMDGLEVCRELRDDELTRKTKIVLVTAWSDESLKIRALERGADDFLTKPFSTVELKTRIANLVRTAKLQREVENRNRRLEETLDQLKAAETQLVHSTKMSALGVMAAGILHEINNPLNYTIMATEALEETYPESDPSGREILDDIRGGMHRIRDIVSDLRAFAYPEQPGRTQEFDIDEAIDSAARFTAHLCNGVKVERRIDARCVALGSKSHVTQVLVNLLSNSIAAIRSVEPDRPGRIDVTARRNGSRLLVAVRDNGVGIEADALTKVFDPFFTTKDVGEGMGLGLSICHTIIRNHGGSIRAISEPGAWTEVTFDLPLANTEN